jgi:hypothetical protein
LFNTAAWLLRLSTSDQRGVTRPQGAGCDIGAYEAEIVNQPPLPVSGGPYSGSESSPIAIDGSGKANFGFVARYKKGQSTPDGNTQFQFKAGGVVYDNKMGAADDADDTTALGGGSIVIHKR